LILKVHLISEVETHVIVREIKMTKYNRLPSIRSTIAAYLYRCTVHSVESFD